MAGLLCDMTQIVLAGAIVVLSKPGRSPQFFSWYSPPPPPPPNGDDDDDDAHCRSSGLNGFGRCPQHQSEQDGVVGFHVTDHTHAKSGVNGGAAARLAYYLLRVDRHICRCAKS